MGLDVRVAASFRNNNNLWNPKSQITRIIIIIIIIIRVTILEISAV
jgi:hypothetical protein